MLCFIARFGRLLWFELAVALVPDIAESLPCGPIAPQALVLESPAYRNKCMFLCYNPADHDWQPTDVMADNFDSIRAHAKRSLGSVREPKLLDVSQLPWAVEPGSCAGVICINMTHIAPFEATVGLLKAGASALRPGGILFIYGDLKFLAICTLKLLHTRLSSANFCSNIRLVADGGGQMLRGCTGTRRRRKPRQPLECMSQ